MVLEIGEKLFIIARRLFDKDLHRHFVGEVVACNNSLARIRGYAFVYDDNSNNFVRRQELRTRIFSLTDAGYIINLLPEDADLEKIHYVTDQENHRMITDGKTFSVNVSEFSAVR